MDVKKELAFTITKELSSEQEAKDAQKYFEDVFQKKDFETKLEERQIKEGKINILDLLCSLKLTESKGQARRLVEQSAVSIDGQKVKDTKHNLEIKKPIVVKVGKRVIKISKE